MTTYLVKNLVSGANTFITAVSPEDALAPVLKKTLLVREALPYEISNFQQYGGQVQITDAAAEPPVVIPPPVDPLLGTGG